MILANIFINDGENMLKFMREMFLETKMLLDGANLDLVTPKACTSNVLTHINHLFFGNVISDFELEILHYDSAFHHSYSLVLKMLNFSIHSF